MKYCPKCVIIKGDDEFYGSKSAADGLSAYCIVCSKEYAEGWKRRNLSAKRLARYKENFKEKNPNYWKERYAANPEAQREKDRLKYERKMKKKYGDSYVVGNPANKLLRPNSVGRQPVSEEEKRRRYIRKVTRRQIERGVLVREPCFVCGSVDVEAHHVHYDLPISVTWLCKKHHKELHSM